MHSPVALGTPQSMAGRTCIFCGGIELTREHVLGDWFRRLADIEGTVPARHTFHPDGEPALAIDYPSPLTWAARVVCGRCNNGWMSEVENAAATVLVPLLRGAPGLLTPDDQAALATWTLKTGCVIDAAAIGGGGPRFPQAHRRWLLEHHSPPALSAAWITTWPGTTTAWTHHWGLEALEQGESSSGSVNAYGATIALGPIVLRGYAATEEPLAPAYIRERRDGVFRIWPPVDAMSWRPQFWLSADELEEFAYGIPQALERGIIPGGKLFFDPDRPDPAPARPS